MANTVYENEVLQAQLTDNLNTKLSAKGYMTVDTSLTASAGMIVKVNKYAYTGTVEKLAKGDKNTARGALAVSSTPYEVELSQQSFDYFDEEVMQDSNVIDMSMNGATNVMVNDLNTKFFAELAKATLSQEYAKNGAISYDTVVDAIAKMNLEDESGLFLIIGNDLKAQIRKDDDFKSKELGKILVDGAIGTISGVPVVCSKLVPAKAAFLATKAAVTCFTKKDSEVEQARDAEARKNTVIMRKVALIALTDATKVVKIVEAAA
jgi:hypothetical protein